MNMGKNEFGGGNANSIYVPLSETEQEVISRLVESGDLHVHINGWGIVHNPLVTYGDLRLAVPLQITFTRPEIPVLVKTLDLELRTGTGILLFKKEMAVDYNGQPLAVGRGTALAMVWHIAIQNIDPKLVKMFKPGATGLTSRLQDKDTGQITLVGNMKLDSRKRKLLTNIRKGEAKARQSDVDRIRKAKQK
jgi:hypothetical protein